MAVTPRDQERIARPLVEPAELRIEILSMFERLGPIMPADPALWRALWMGPDRPARDEVARTLAALVRDGLLRRIVLGSELHLAIAFQNEPVGPDRADPGQSRAARPSLLVVRTRSEPDRNTHSASAVDDDDDEGTAAETPTAETPAAGPAAAGPDAIASLEIAIDTERERLVLYRVAIVLQILVLLILARQVWL